ncbi:MAG: efflux RND transporter periplasmic adaptor subunit [Minicystis sp.]
MDPKRQKNLLRAVVVLAVLGGGGWLANTRLREARAAGKEGGGQADRVVPVVVTKVAQHDMPVYLDGLGNVVASATVTVRPQVDGRLDRVLFREGQEVKKGDVLAQIDPRPFQNQLHLAEAALARDRAQLAGAQRNLDRYSEMRKDGLSSQQQVDDQRATVAQLDATTRADAAQIESAKLNLDYARVTAPIDGVTGVRLVDAGNVVRSGDASGLVVITAIDPIAVIFTLPQDDLPRIGKQLAQGPVRVEALSRDGSTKLATGTIALVDNQINQATATIRLKATFENPTRALWPNQLVKVRVLLTTRAGALVVPSAVVQRGPQGTFAYVVGADEKAAVRPIQIEGGDGELTVVTSGLAAGDQVVVDGQYQLKPGAKVSTRPEGGGPGGGKEGKEGKAPEGKGGKEGKGKREGHEGKAPEGKAPEGKAPEGKEAPGSGAAR